MNESTKIVANSSSIIDLKAELYRKQELFRLQKLSQTANTNHENLSNKKYKLGKRIREKAVKTINRNKPVDNKLDTNFEDENILKNSRQMLEMKSKLYDKLCRNQNRNIDDDYDERILVDFDRKSVEQSAHQLSESSEQIDVSSDNDDDWTEFVDSLGRTRKCLKKDLPYFEKLDRNVCDAKNHVNNNRNNYDNFIRESNTISTDSSRNNESSTDPLKPVSNVESDEQNLTGNGLVNDGPLHYQNVQFNEVRDHGVAYYGFSKHADLRKQQMDALNNLREQTKKQTLIKQKVKEKRKQLIRDRLTKIAQRKGIEVEFPPSSDSDNEVELPEQTIKEDPPKSVPTSVREWDIGKAELDMIRPKPKLINNYIENRRNERDMDFAPPSSYANETNSKFSNKNVKNKANNNNDKLMSAEISAQIINRTSDESCDRNKSHSCSTKPDANQMIGEALAYFRNNAK